MLSFTPSISLFPLDARQLCLSQREANKARADDRNMALKRPKPLTRLKLSIVTFAGIYLVYKSSSYSGLANANEDQPLDEFADPSVLTRRCDACRAIANRFDLAFDLAEAALLDNRPELDDGEAGEVASMACERRVYSEAKPMLWRGQQRLALKGLETWVRLERHPQSEELAQVDWSQRLENHCRSLAKSHDVINVSIRYLSGEDSHVMYKMWLHSSAGRSRKFESFLCYGDERSRYGDCTW